jgi:hypothetical protein
LPGAGKSTAVRWRRASLAWDGVEFVVCSSDDHFIGPDGVYRFALAELPDAHAACQQKCLDAMARGVSVVLIDNTNVTARECRPYVDLAQRYGYTVEFVEPSTPWAFDLTELSNRNTHGVPLATLQRMLSRWVPDMTVEKALTADPAPGKPTNDERCADLAREVRK